MLVLALELSREPQTPGGVWLLGSTVFREPYSEREHRYFAAQACDQQNLWTLHTRGVWRVCDKPSAY